jgi:CBS-domain-containing membrane protein
MERDTRLATQRLQRGTLLAQAEPWHSTAVSLDSAALAVMTDLTKVKAATTMPSTTLRQAEQLMIYQGVRMLFVVSEMPSLEGLLTSTDLHGDRVMRVVQQRNVRYDELCVADVMTGLPMLEAVDYEQMKTAKVRQVVAALRSHGRKHLLVVEAASAQAPQRVRGVISLAQVERQLGSALQTVEIADSFAEMSEMLA